MLEDGKDVVVAKGIYYLCGGCQFRLLSMC